MNLREYRVSAPPVLPGSERLYLAEELRRISQAIGLLVEAARKLDERLSANGL